MCQFSGKIDNLEFFGPYWPKNEFRVGVSESSCSCRNKNQHPRDTMFANFQTKQTTLTFSTKTCPKLDFGLEFQKSKFEFEISTSKILGVSIFSKNGQL